MPPTSCKPDLVAAIVDRAFIGEDELPRTPKALRGAEEARQGAAARGRRRACTRHAAAIVDASQERREVDRAESRSLGRVAQDVKAQRAIASSAPASSRARPGSASSTCRATSRATRCACRSTAPTPSATRSTTARCRAVGPVRGTREGRPRRRAPRPEARGIPLAHRGAARLALRAGAAHAACRSRPSGCRSSGTSTCARSPRA